MSSLTKAGGLAAFVEAICYVIGFAMIATVLNPGNAGDWSQAQKLGFVLENKRTFQLWNIIIYVIFGVALVVLGAALHQLLSKSAASTMMVATPFGLIWAGLVIASGMVANLGLDLVAETYAHSVEQAVAAWSIISAVEEGLGGGVELVGGMWVFLLSIAARRGSDVFPKALVYLGFFVGTTGILTLIPTLGELGAVFGISQIVWFVFIGGILLRRQNAQPAVQNGI